MFGAGSLNVLLHGTSGVALGYGTVTVSLLAGLTRGGASRARQMAAPLWGVPATLAAGTALTLGAPLLRALEVSLSSPLALGAALGLSTAVGYGLGKLLAQPSSRSRVYERGALLQDARERVRPGRRSRDTARVHERGAALTLAGVRVAESDETKHFKLIGTTGTGKSTAIHELLAVALARGDRAVIADPDGGYLRRFYDARRGDVVLNPFMESARKWDLFGEITDAYDVEQLARSLVPDHEGADRSWRGYARTFLTAVTRQAHAAGVRDVAELYRLLTIARAGELRTLVEGTPAQPFLEEHNGRMFDSIRSVTSSAVAALEHVSQQRTPLLSIREWVRAGRATNGSGAAARPQSGVLFIPYRAGQIAALHSQISAWMRLAIFETLNAEEGDQRLWFIVDELDALGPIDGLKDALARLRKFGGRCVLGFQSIAQVSSTYGEGSAHTIVENCGNTLLLRCSGSEGGGTSRFASGLIGEREVRRTTASRSQRDVEWFGSRTRSEHFATELALLPAQVEQLPDLSGYLKLASRPGWLRVALLPDGRERSSGGAQAPARPAGTRSDRVASPSMLLSKLTEDRPAAADRDRAASLDAAGGHG
jgi:hypothetical protein